MYYSFPCPKCAVILSEFENQQEGDNDAMYRLCDLVKQHYQQMHDSSDFVYTDEELLNMVKVGMSSSDTKPY